MIRCCTVDELGTFDKVGYETCYRDIYKDIAANRALKNKEEK